MPRQLFLFSVPASATTMTGPRPARPRPPPGPGAIGQAVQRCFPAAEVRVHYRRSRRQLFRWVRHPDGSVDLHANEVFRTAPADIAEALARSALTRHLDRSERRHHTATVREWFALSAETPALRVRVLPPAGTYHDLRPLLAQSQARLAEPIDTDVGWSLRPARRLLGRFERAAPRPVIVVNSALDAPLVPEWYFDFLLFHELLHAVVPAIKGSGRLLMHPPEFRRRERVHPDFELAKKFERWATGPGFRLLRVRASMAHLPDDFRR